MTVSNPPPLFPFITMSNRVFFAATFSALIALPLLAETPAQRLAQKSAEWFQGKEATHTLDCILSWQNDHGGWPQKDTTTKPFSGDREKLRGTFSDGATTGELRLLARAARLTGDNRYKKALTKGIDHILATQLKNGGWPQHFPTKKESDEKATFRCMIPIIQLLRDLEDDDLTFLDASHRSSVETAIQKGIDCIINSQLVVKGERTGWSEYVETLAPAEAKLEKTPSINGSETASILIFLMESDSPSLETIEAVRSGLAWIQESAFDGDTDWGDRVWQAYADWQNP